MEDYSSYIGKWKGSKQSVFLFPRKCIILVAEYAHPRREGCYDNPTLSYRPVLTQPQPNITTKHYNQAYRCLYKNTQDKIPSSVQEQELHIYICSKEGRYHYWLENPFTAVAKLSKSIYDGRKTISWLIEWKDKRQRFGPRAKTQTSDLHSKSARVSFPQPEATYTYIPKAHPSPDVR